MTTVLCHYEGLTITQIKLSVVLQSEKISENCG